jgi:hypothetical protein
LGGRLGTGMARTLILPRLILGWLVSCGDGAARQAGRLPGDIVVERVFILESRHTRTLDGPGKASPGHTIRKQFGKLTRAANAKRWPEQLQA